MAFEHLNQQTHLTSGGVVLDHLLIISFSFLFLIKICQSKVDFVSPRGKLKSIIIEFKNMSRRNGRGGDRKLDLKLNLSPPTANRQTEELPTRSATMSPTSSCVSSEAELRYSSSPEATSMMLVGCPRCLMYVMLAEEYPKCPKCKSTVLLDVLHDNSTKKTRKA